MSHGTRDAIGRRITELEAERARFELEAHQRMGAFAGAIAELRRLLEVVTDGEAEQ